MINIALKMGRKLKRTGENETVFSEKESIITSKWFQKLG